MPSPIKVKVTGQVLAFQARQHPELRRALKAGILGLASGRGDLKALHDNLEGYSRLAVRGVRVIFRIRPDGGIECVFAERRRLVYELFATTLRERLD